MLDKFVVMNQPTRSLDHSILRQTPPFHPSHLLSNKHLKEKRDGDYYYKKKYLLHLKETETRHLVLKKFGELLSPKAERLSMKKLSYVKSRRAPTTTTTHPL